MAADGLTAKRRAIWRMDGPYLTARTKRRHRSGDNGADIGSFAGHARPLNWIIRLRSSRKCVRWKTTLPLW